MLSNEQMNKIEELTAYFEKEHFYGVFSESTIRTDLETRAARDRLSRLGSSGRQTNNLGEKKRVYYDSFDKDIELINKMLSLNPPSSYISRLEKCKNQVNKLYDFVQNF